MQIKNFNSPIKQGSLDSHHKERLHHHHIVNSTSRDEYNKRIITDSAFFSSKKNSPRRKVSIESASKTGNVGQRNRSSSLKKGFENSDLEFSSFRNGKYDESFDQSQPNKSLKPISTKFTNRDQ